MDSPAQLPVPGVTIHDRRQNISAMTDVKGHADISNFKNSDSIEFRHLAYKPLVLSYEQIEKKHFKITLYERPFSLDEVVISASRFEERLKDVAQPVEVIKSKELAFMNQQTSAEVMQNTGNVFVQKSQMGGGSPVIRGFETNKVLMVVDGVRMNNAIYRGGHLQNIITLDNTIMEKVEVIFGPGSVVYGSDALGGVMHFYTKNPVLSDTGMAVHANAFTRYSTAANEKTGHLDFSLGGKKLGSFSSVTFSDFGDMRQGSQRDSKYGDWGLRTFYAERVNGKDSMLVNEDPNIQRQSGYSQLDLLQKFLFEQNENVSHVFNFQYSTSSDIPRYDRLTLLQGGKPRFAEWYYGPQKRLFSSYTLNLKSKNKIYDNARVIASYQNIEESRMDRRFGSNKKNYRKENLNIVSLNADFAKKIKIHEIRFGLDGWYNQIESNAFVKNIVSGEKRALDTRYPDGGSSMQNMAAYITHSAELSEKFIFNGGVRLSNVQLKAEFIDTTFYQFPFSNVSQNNTAVNGNLGAVYMPGTGWRYTLLGSSAFRAPNVDDLSKVFESVPGSVLVPNPDLRPEYTYNVDAEISKTMENYSVSLTGFYTWYIDAITTAPGTFNGEDSILYGGQLSRVSMSVNAAQAYLYGYNAAVNANLTKNISVFSTLNYTYGRIVTDSTDYPLDHIPPLYGKTGVSVKVQKFRGEFFALYNDAKKSEDYNLRGEDNQAYSADPINGFMPAWMTLNLRTAYQLHKNLQVQFAVENILDKHYRSFASNISAPGRNFIFTLRGSF